MAAGGVATIEWLIVPLGAAAPSSDPVSYGSVNHAFIFVTQSSCLYCLRARAALEECCLT